MNNCSIRKWVGHKLDAAIEQRLQRLAGANDVTEIAVMPDVHLAGDVCNGVVVATQQLIYPQCIGGDIGCGYLSVELSLEKDIDETTAAKILHGLYQSVPINKHSNRKAIDLDVELSSPKLVKAANREGSLQLGTLGRGNHFVELQRNNDGQTFCLIHSGSRAMGQMISAYHLYAATIDSVSKLKFVDCETERGRALLNDIQWARQYASQNRLSMLDAIAKTVLEPIGIEVKRSTTIHLDHNHVQQETHDECNYWVHRKGAQGLMPDQRSVIPGSMGSTTYVVAGRGHREALNSCSHGAGRSMSRSEAIKRTSPRKLKREMREVWFDHRKSASLIDEAPSAYKSIRKVLKSQRELVRIIDQRRPILSFKGR